MSTRETELGDFTYKGQRSVLMACAVGFGAQPVLCNIIGSEPLFYIEEDIELNGESGLYGEEIIDDAFFHLSEMSPERLARLRDACAQMERDRVHSSHTTLSQDKALLSGTDTLAPLSLNDILETARKSGQLTSSLAFAENHDIAFTVTDMVKSADYDREGGQILINPAQPMDQAINALARCLRLVEHHKSGLLLHPLFFDPEQAITINRVMEADLAVFSLRCAWDLKLAGDKDYWVRMISGSTYDIASAFAREAIADFRSLTNGQANLAAFEQWFLSSRCKQADRKLIQTMLADHHGYVFDNQHFTKNLTKDILARLGDSQIGQNYLLSILDQVLTDPLYNEVRDRSNANFLWFIKFERSFRDSEEAIASAEGQTAQNEVASGELIRMSDHRPFGSSQSEASGKGDDDGATIYYFTHFVGL